MSTSPAPSPSPAPTVQPVEPATVYPQSIFDTSTCLKKGFCEVFSSSSHLDDLSSNRESHLAQDISSASELESESAPRERETHKLYYEMHGDPCPGPRAKRLVFIMGLNNSSFGWSSQVAHFATQRGFQLLLFDNRGVGHSDSPGQGAAAGSSWWPRLPLPNWSVKDMARDLVALLRSREVGWLQDEDADAVESGNLQRQAEEEEKIKLDVIGVSMGGMIALHLALLIPSSIRSLLLTSTKSGHTPLYRDLPSLAASWMFLRLLTGTVRSPERGIALIVGVLFPSEYLEQEEGEEEGESKGKDKGKRRTRRQRLEEEFLFRWKIGRRQTVRGRIGQMGAVLRHSIPPPQLLEIARSIPRIAIITGDQDQLIDPRRSDELAEGMPGSTLKIIRGAGHALPSQCTEEYNAWIEEVVSGDH